MSDDQQELKGRSYVYDFIWAIWINAYLIELTININYIHILHSLGTHFEGDLVVVGQDVARGSDLDLESRQHVFLDLEVFSCYSPPWVVHVDSVGTLIDEDWL